MRRFEVLCRRSALLVVVFLSFFLSAPATGAQPLRFHPGVTEAEAPDTVRTAAPWPRQMRSGWRLALHPAKERQAASIQLVQQDAMPFRRLTSDQLSAMLPNKDFFFVNVHIPYEGEIAGTDGFIPFDRIAENIDRLPEDKDRPIVLYCLSGRMSEIAAREFLRLGYSKVSDLAGGMIDWKESGFEVIESR